MRSQQLGQQVLELQMGERRVRDALHRDQIGGALAGFVHGPRF